MGALSDRIVLTIITVTAIVAFGGYLVTVLMTTWSDWYLQNVLPVIAAVALVVVVFAVWEGFGLMD